MNALAVLAPPIMVIAALLAIYKLALCSRVRVTPFSLARARTRARSATTSNGLLILAGINLAALVFELAAESSRLLFPAGALAAFLAILALSALLLTVVVRSLADLLIGAIGIASTLLGAYVQAGADGLLAVIALSMLTLFLLGLVRGFLNPL